MNDKYALQRLLLLGLMVFGGTASLHAQDEARGQWSFEAQLSSVWAGGNSESNTVGARAKAQHKWPNASWSASGGFWRTESSIKTRRAVGTTDSFDLVETTTTETTAEAYFARTKFDQNLNQQIHLLVGVDWLRNAFSGIDSRFLVAGGAGVNLSDTEELTAKVDVALTYTFEEEVVDNPFLSGTFPGLRGQYVAKYRVTETTDLESELVGDWNLDNTKDVRLDWTNAVSVAINSSLALRPRASIQWRNDPAFASVKLFNAEGEQLQGTVVVPLEKIDWFLNLAIVLKI